MATAKRLLEVIWQASQPGFGSVGAQSQLIPEKTKIHTWVCEKCGKKVEATDEQMYSRMVTCPDCGAAMGKNAEDK